MNAIDFVASWETVDEADLESMIERLRDETALTASAAACLRHSAEIGAHLRRDRRRHQACMAAHEASQAVLVAARRTGVDEGDRAGVIQLARVAGEVARALTAEVRTAALDDLLGLLGTRCPVPGPRRCAKLA